MARGFVANQDLGTGLDLDGDCELDGTFDVNEVESYLAMGIDPIKPTAARPGSEEKVLMLSARYSAGLPLWHDRDCYEHGPRESELMGFDPAVKRPVAIEIGADDDDLEVADDVEAED
ncbi:MAG: hypothetical protein HZA46_25275 [Planctomycetales bacterium]|nr:hypothetical protein [Planctomycetales bacterium]